MPKLRIAQKHVDNYLCIQPFAEYVELRFSMNNLRTLCQECHYFITFGKKKPECVKLWGVSRKEQSYG